MQCMWQERSRPPIACHCWCTMLCSFRFFHFLRAIMVDVKGDNRVLSLVARSGIRNLLINLLDQLQRCQKSLNEFLEVS